MPRPEYGYSGPENERGSQANESSLNTRHHFAIAGKGIETRFENLLSEIFQLEIGRSVCMAVLSGLDFTIATAKTLPSAMLLACQQTESVAQLQKTLHKPWFRLYRSSDLIGVQVWWVQ